MNVAFLSPVPRTSLGPLRSSDQLREKEDNLFAPVMDDEPTEQDLTDEGLSFGHAPEVWGSPEV